MFIDFPVKVSGIYAFVNTEDNNKVYIGSSGNLLIRLSYHRAMLGSGKHKNARLQAAWDEFGEEAFRICIFEKYEYITREDLYSREQDFIDEWKSTEPEFGYNIHLIVNSPQRMSSIRKCSAKAH